ncbi:unnamed protein product [Heterobilharzia americana]|nr:unnamed protein product [Heterobilharzia americana]
MGKFNMVMFHTPEKCRSFTLDAILSFESFAKHKKPIYTIWSIIHLVMFKEHYRTFSVELLQNICAIMAVGKLKTSYPKFMYIFTKNTLQSGFSISKDVPIISPQLFASIFPTDYLLTTET